MANSVKTKKLFLVFLRPRNLHFTTARNGKKEASTFRKPGWETMTMNGNAAKGVFVVTGTLNQSARFFIPDYSP